MQAFSSRINIPLLHEPHNDTKNGRFFVENLPFLFPKCLKFVAERHRRNVPSERYIMRPRNDTKLNRFAVVDPESEVP